MITRLAKLADLKTLIGDSEGAMDALLTQLLEQSSRRCEGVELAGRPLMRQASIVEYPWYPDAHRMFNQTFRVDRFPIESITSIKQRYGTSTDAQFTAETALVEFTDWTITGRPAGDPKNRGLIERVNGSWTLRPRYLQVIYTGGFMDPANLEVIAVAANADAIEVRAGEAAPGGVTLHYAGESPAVDALTDDDTTYIWIEDNGTGQAQIGSAVDATGWPAPGTDHVRLAEVTMAGGVIVAINDVRGKTSDSSTGWVFPPEDLQQGILNDALANFNTRGTAGIEDIALAGGGGFRTSGNKPHRQLMDACQRLRTFDGF